jgi:hypothetical protein
MAVILIAVCVVGFLAFEVGNGKIDLSNLHLPFGVMGGGGGLANVTKKLQFTFTNEYTGAASASKTFYIYDGSILQETLTTDSDGIKSTARTYPSGQVLAIKYVDANSKKWYNVVVPQMNSLDAQSATVNPIALKTFSIGTYGGTISSSGTIYATNYGVGNGSTPAFNYEVVNSGADNTGMMDSDISDPVYGQAWQTYLEATITGGEYEKVIMSGFDQVFTLGTTQYGVIKVDPHQLTKWKVGNNYQTGYQGDQILHFGLDLTGLTANTTILTIYVRAYADPSFAQFHGGNFGSSTYQLATSTLTFLYP